MNNEDIFEGIEGFEQDKGGNSPKIPTGWVIMLVTLALFAAALLAEGLKPAENDGTAADSSAAVSDSSVAAAHDESSATFPDTDTSEADTAETDTAEAAAVRSLTREANRYLVYPEEYNIELKSFPEGFSDEDKEGLINALGRYSYEEGFKCLSAEYSSGLQSNCAAGYRVFGMCLNGMEDFFVTAIREPENSEFLFVMDRRTLNTARKESPVENEDESENRSIESAVTGTPAPTATKSPTVTPSPRPTATPSPRPTATPTPVPTSDYQPDAIEIRGIPGEIADAIVSPEEFRNSLYNFMYDNDIHGTVILADAYYEKYGDSIFDFTLTVSEKTVYARYDAGLNEYYYSFEKFE